MPDIQEVKSNRDRYKERLKAKYPDKEYIDDEALFGQINDDYDYFDQQLSSYQESEKALSDMLASNPRMGAFLVAAKNGEDPVIALTRRFGDDFKAALEDPDMQDALAEANKEYAERVSEEQKYEEEYKANIQESLKTIESLQQEEGWTDKEIDSAMEFLMEVMRDAILGKFSKENIMMALNAINHDNDVEMADREGEVRGRNARIEEKLRKKKKGDGIINLGSNGGNNSRKVPELGALNNFGSSTIWGRGGEKRTSFK